MEGSKMSDQATETTEVQETQVETQEAETQQEYVSPIGLALGEIEMPEKKVEEPVTPTETQETGEKQEEPVTTTEEKQEEIKSEETQQTEETQTQATIEPNQEILDLRKEIDGLKAGISAERQKRQSLENEKKQAFDWTKPDESIQNLKNELRQENLTNFVNMSESQCAQRHQDYYDKRVVLLEMINQNPAIYQDMLRQADPAEYGYQLATKQMFVNEVGTDPAAYKEKLKAEIMTELKTEKETQLKEKENIAAKLPPSSESIGDKTVIKTKPQKPLDRLFPDSIPSG